MKEKKEIVVGGVDLGYEILQFTQDEIGSGKPKRWAMLHDLPLETAKELLGQLAAVVQTGEINEFLNRAKRRGDDDHESV